MSGNEHSRTKCMAIVESRFSKAKKFFSNRKVLLGSYFYIIIAVRHNRDFQPQTLDK